jgi:hypothetical protein
VFPSGLGATTIEVDERAGVPDPAINSLTIKSNSTITLDFQTAGAARTLTVSGDIKLDLLAGVGTGLTLKANGSNGATVSAANLNPQGNPAGWMNLTVQRNITLSLSQKLDTGGTVVKT